LGGGDFLELREFVNKIKEKVKVEMGIEIEEEVVLI
jgi:UDP-N-acetylenolpyruvoylglucosamine reductase